MTMTSTVLQRPANTTTRATTTTTTVDKKATKATNATAARNRNTMAWSHEKLRFSCIDNIGLKQLWKLIALDTASNSHSSHSNVEQPKVNSSNNNNNNNEVSDLAKMKANKKNKNNNITAAVTSMRSHIRVESKRSTACAQRKWPEHTPARWHRPPNFTYVHTYVWYYLKKCTLFNCWNNCWNFLPSPSYAACKQNCNWNSSNPRNANLHVVCSMLARALIKTKKQTKLATAAQSEPEWQGWREVGGGGGSDDYSGVHLVRINKSIHFIENNWKAFILFYVLFPINLARRFIKMTFTL